MSINFNKLKPTTLGLDSMLDFGQYFGYTVLEVLKDQPEYIRWLIKVNKKFHPSVYKVIPKYTLVSKDYQHRYNNEYHNVLSDQDDWWEDVPF